MVLGGIPRKVQVGDMGVDGRIFPVGTKPTAGGLFSEDWLPIQLKQVDKVGRPDVDLFCHTMTRENRQRRFFVSFGYSKDVEAECARFLKGTGRILNFSPSKRFWMRSMCRRCEALVAYWLELARVRGGCL